MKIPRFRLGFAILLLLILVIAASLLWSSDRFTRINVCTSCHEIFADYDTYKPVETLSTSLEDHKPSKPYDPGLFNVTVGCAECHAYPYEEYLDSPHYYNDRGVKPGCVDCHESHTLVDFLIWKFLYFNEGSFGESPFHAISTSLRDVPAWEDLRVSLAERVRNRMFLDKDLKCKSCHKPESQWFNKIESHQTGKKTDKTCVQCHYNLVHKSVKWKDIEVEAARDSD